MDIQLKGCDRAHCLHHQGAKRDVGYEMPVHDIDVDEVGSCRFHCTYFIPETTEIS
jgi:hypothetical protein